MINLIGDKKTKVGEDEESKRNSNEMPKRIRLRSALLVNLRPTTGIQAISYNLPFHFNFILIDDCIMYICL